MAKVIRFTHETSGGCEHEHELPARFEVCPDCDGHGTHLTPGIREHAYTREEFDDAFHEDDERADYFRRGGRYDVACETCRGQRVIAVVDQDEARRTLRGRRLLAIHDAVSAQDAAFEAQDRAERRMGY